MDETRAQEKKLSSRQTADNFLLSLKQEDYLRAYEYTQSSWRTKQYHTPEWLLDNLSHKRIVRYTFLREEVKTSVFVSVEYMIRFRVGTELRKGIIKFNLICESKPYETSKEGTWGVNPISALNIREI